MLKLFKPGVEKVLAKIVSKGPQIPPNVITVIGILPPVLFYYFLSQHMMLWAVISYCGVLLDLLDGVYARATNRVTSYGAFLDSTLDRLADAIFIAAFGAAGLVRWPIVIGVIIFSFLISYSRSRGETISPKGEDISQGPIERAERLGLVFLALISQIGFPQFSFQTLNAAEIVFLILFLLSAITVIRRMKKVYDITK